jgi:predicted ester cyclase
MKKLILVSFAAVCSFFIACDSDQDEISAVTKKNMEVNKAIMTAYEAGDFSKMGDYIAADAVDHGSEKGDVKGLDSIVAMMKMYRNSMSDMKSEVIKELADDEYVMTWAKFSGTTTADAVGMPPNQKVEMSSVDLTKFKDGKAVEHWVFMDPNEMMKMMMSSQPGQMPAAADTTSKK